MNQFFICQVQTAPSLTPTRCKTKLKITTTKGTS